MALGHVQESVRALVKLSQSKVLAHNWPTRITAIGLTGPDRQQLDDPEVPGDPRDKGRPWHYLDVILQRRQSLARWLMETDELRLRGSDFRRCG
jgi:hypothetical protein